MKYLCLVYLDTAHRNACSDQVCADYVQRLVAGQRLVAAEPLHPTHTATTVRVRNGEVTCSTGPSPPEATIRGRVKVVMPVGSDQLIGLHADEDMFFRVAKESRYRAGDEIVLGLNVNRLHVFDTRIARHPSAMALSLHDGRRLPWETALTVWAAHTLLTASTSPVASSF